MQTRPTRPRTDHLDREHPRGRVRPGARHYSITLNGTFADSDHLQPAHRRDVNFFADSSVTLSAANTSLSYPDPSTTLSGQVTLTYPDNTADTDYSAPP